MPRQFKLARQIKKLTMTEAAEKLGVSQPTMSCWEGGHKTPSIEGLEHMADLYSVTTDFLLGRSDQIDVSPSVPVSANSLLALHGKPVWSAEQGWMLVNAIDKVLIGLDGPVSALADSKDLYTLPPLFAEPTLPTGEPLALSEIKEARQIWLEPISPDLKLRDELRGWYQVNERYVQNEYGNRFYLDTYQSKWLAFNLQP